MQHDKQLLSCEEEKRAIIKGIRIIYRLLSEANKRVQKCALSFCIKSSKLNSCAEHTHDKKLWQYKWHAFKHLCFTFVVACLWIKVSNFYILKSWNYLWNVIHVCLTSASKFTEPESFRFQFNARLVCLKDIQTQRTHHYPERHTMFAIFSVNGDCYLTIIWRFHSKKRYDEFWLWF